MHATVELPTRLAHRLKDLSTLPESVRHNDSVGRVKQWYEKSFGELAVFADLWKDKQSDAITIQEWTKLTDVLKTIAKRHQPVATTLAEGFHRHIATHPENDARDDSLQEFLDRFHLSRIGMRTTSTQHLTLLGQTAAVTQRRDGYCGIIEHEMNIPQVLQKAAADARQVCVDYYGISTAPQVQMDLPDNLAVTYIPGYLWHIAFEILKNSMRAIVETFEEPYAPIAISLIDDADNVVIKISDQGGGIPAKQADLVWRYMYTTANSPYSPSEAEEQIENAAERAIMAGFGYGLPISRLYAKFCGGTVTLQNHESRGVDCMIILPKVCKDQEA
ncbi:pyruvate dehydrogenase kinase [Protomyces lactucae-debilis]|uniref:Protein-serine/threonine kinase n=1 Tax=Protomyces lactucae-debilis TaxID=2754530 RepID=A0A1Y2FID7_PROLT|nr:pyruvate dehydrogenase kinase [Protomyces lactucae-debilis]ORY83154.1 pyruvate dehydrogenase kinase [Protomyces lactucae-debilis]